MSDLFSRKKNHTLTSRSLKNLKNDNTSPSLNIEQILINWINTIAEPHCLLLENLFCSDVIETGIIFIEILKNFLRFFGINDFNPDYRLTKEEKVNLVLTSLMALNKENKFDNFHRQKINYFFNHNKEIFLDKNELISFFELLKNVYDKYGLNNEQVKIKNLSYDKKENENFEVNNNQRNNNIINQNNNNSNINNINNNNIIMNNTNNNDKYKYENKFLQNYKDNKKQDAFLEYELKQKRKKKFQSFYNNFTIKNNNNNLLNILLSPQIKEKQIKKHFSSSLSPIQNIGLSISPTKNIENNFSLKKKSKLFDSNEKKNISQSTNINSVSSKKDNINNINSENNDDIHKNEKKYFSLINMTIGLYNKLNNNNDSIYYYNFFRPTKPIIDTSINTKIGKFLKFNQLLNKNINFNREKINEESNYNNIFKKEKDNEIEFPKITNSIKTNIKNWLISLNLFSKSNISNESIVNLSHNGILFCDIINKFNNTKPIIINKKITKESSYSNNQKKININKFFNYTYNNPKIYQYIKSYVNYIDELILKNEDIIYGILYGLYKYYNMENKLNIPIPKIKYQNVLKNHNNGNYHSAEKNILKKNNKTLKSIRSWLGKNSINSNINISKENYDDSNFLNAFSINSEFNLNNSFDNNYNEKHIKRKSFFKINSPSVSQCSSIGVSISSNTTFDDLKEFTKYNNNNIQNNFHNKKINSSSSMNNIHKDDKKYKTNNLLNNQNSPNKEKLRMIKNSFNINNEQNPKCFLLFKGSNLNKMKKETEKVINFN